MCIHTNTNTIYQWRCKSWSLRHLVQPLFSSSSSFLDMDRVLFFRHRSWTWTESYSFEQDTSQTWCHSETSVVKAGATYVRDNAILPSTVSGDGAGARSFNTGCVRQWRWCTLPSLFYGGGSSVKSLGSHGGVGWELRRLGEKWWKSLIISDNQDETCLIITINDTSLGYLPLIINISDTCKNQPKRLDFDNTINLSIMIVILAVDYSTSSVRCSRSPWKQKSAVPSPRLHLYVLHSILMGRLSLQEQILTHHTRKHLVY
jgi:hypothetical protein